ncbi:MAG TPA: aldo/keto reductase [Ktedonobacteraceae bacterium]|jgi:aryl-alcohol dehydrogenase-like predicted oxidoreductase
MKTRQLGNSDLHITPIGMGTRAISGSNGSSGWKEQDDTAAIAAIRRALDLGINWIDTAPAYGSGRAEEIVARALEGGVHRPYIFTTCRLARQESERESSNKMRATLLQREIEGSLRRLQVDVIDLCYIHRPGLDEDSEEGWSTLAALQQEGKVRSIGVSNFNVGQMRRALAIVPLTALQVPYSLINRQAEQELFPLCRQEHIGVTVCSPLQNGLLSGQVTREHLAHLSDNDWRKHDKAFEEPQLSRALALVEKLREIAGLYQRTPAEAAIAWTLTNPAVTAATVGMHQPVMVESNIGAAEFRFTGRELREIEDLCRASV